MRNSHGLHNGDFVKCIKSYPDISGYFREGDVYEITDEPNQTYKDEIFMLDYIDNWNSGVRRLLVKYIADEDFKDYFIIDIKETRIRKLEKIYNNVK